MSKEEREAINRCKELIKDTHKEWIDISNQVAIETVLQLIEEQDNKIMQAKEWLTKYVDNGTNCNCGDLQLVLNILEE